MPGSITRLLSLDLKKTFRIKWELESVWVAAIDQRGREILCA
jgi:hypothetical protein